tara:strand:+ start:2298 stop:2483 length:186 start_codon:yes stop_codon:yes gene_type:complete
VAEELISQEKYEDALTQYEKLFNEYDFIFLRDYKIASQISFLILPCAVSIYVKAVSRVSLR